MKKNFAKLFAPLFLLMIVSCSDDNSEDLDIDVSNINFTVNITSPDQNRDQSFHNNGMRGVFEDPAETKNIQGKIIISSGYSSVIPEDFIVKWSSDLDGLLFEGHPGDSYNSEFTGLLSKGHHKIIFESYIDGHIETVKKDSMYISNFTKLETEGLGNSVKLTWDKYEGADFASYLIYRDNFQPIAQITDINQIEYIDSEIPDIITINKYQVVVQTSLPSQYVIGSTFSECTATKFALKASYVRKVMKHPYQNKLYALLGGNVEGGNERGLAVLNTETMLFENNVLTGQLFSDMAISSDGNKMYLTQKSVDKITIIDLATMAVSYITTSTNGWGFEKVEYTDTDYLICHRGSPTSGNSPLMLVNKYNGTTTSFMSHSHGDIVYNSINNKLYAGESNTSSGFLRTAAFSGNSLQWEGMFPINWQYGITYPHPYVLLSDNKNHIFWETYQLDQNMNVVRELNTRIKACSPNDIYIADITKVYRFIDMSPVFDFSNLPTPDTVQVVFMNDNTVIVTIAIDDHWTDQPESTYFLKFELP